LVLLAAMATIFRRSYSAAWRDEMFILMPMAVIFLFVSQETGFSAHSRYVIPALPYLFIWTSKIARAFALRPISGARRALSIAIAGGILWSLISSLAVFPHSLSYFNELAAILPVKSTFAFSTPVSKDFTVGYASDIRWMLTSGARHGPRHLLDSNVDWSQDIVYLAQWLSDHPEVKLRGLDCFGCCPTTLAGIPDTPRPPIQDDYDNSMTGIKAAELQWLQPGWYALSVNRLFDHRLQYHYFQQLRPTAMVGFSIYIYHVTAEDAARLALRLGS
jgi:hypothetical protein